MLARWPSLFIQAVITSEGVCWPMAMFSPPRLVMPSALARSQGLLPSGSVWSKKFLAAMSSLKFWARVFSAGEAVSAAQPFCRRCTFTRDRISAWSAATMASGAPLALAVALGVALGLGEAVVALGVGEGVGVALGFGFAVAVGRIPRPPPLLPAAAAAWVAGLVLRWATGVRPAG